MTYEAALKMMADVLEGLGRSEMAEPGAPLTEDAVLIGAGAILDSLGFVTFVAEVEDRLNHERDEPLELILTEIWEFNTENPSSTSQAARRSGSSGFPRGWWGRPYATTSASPSSTPPSPASASCSSTSRTSRRRASLTSRTPSSARVIENQAIIIEVNRTGTDGNGLHYERRSTVIDANGEPLEPVATEGEIDLFQLDRARFLAFRTAFPTRQDRRPAVYRRMFDASPDPTAPGSHNG